MAETDKDDLISIIEDDRKDEKIPGILPLMPVRDIVMFTDMVLPLFVGREKSMRAVQEAVAKEGYLFLATQKDPAIENPDTDEIFSTGINHGAVTVINLPGKNAVIEAKNQDYTQRIQ